MNKAIAFVTNDFPRAPSILFSAWIVSLVISDLLTAFGVISETPIPKGIADQNAVVHFVKFQTIELQNFNIMIGTQYRVNDGSEPEKQWCYVDTPSKEGSHRLNIGLADKIGILPVTYREMSQNTANKLGLSPSSLKKLAKSRCNFL